METTGTTATETSTGALIGTASQPAVSSEQAQAEISTLRHDKTFTAKLLSKDPTANAQWTRLHEAAFPEPADESTGAGQPTQPNADGLDDAAVFAPPSSPAGYKFDRLPQGVQHDIQQEQFIRESFHHAGIPQGIASQIDRMFTESMSKPPSAQALEMTRQQTQLQLERVHGSDAARVVEVARREFNTIASRPGGERLVEMAERSGLGNSFYVINSLYNNARAKGRA